MRRRGVIILAVAVAISVASLAAATMLFVAWAHAESGRRSTERARLHALAWSGVQGAMAELVAQRETLLLGGDPLLTPEWTLFEDEGVRGRVRLVPIAGASVAMSEAAKLDVNTATAEMLSRLPGLGGSRAGGGAADGEPVPVATDGVRARGVKRLEGVPAGGAAAEPVGVIASRIVAQRGGGRLPNAEAIGEVEGVTREMLEGKRGGSAPGMGGLRRTEMATPGLLDLLGVFAAEPDASIGATGTASDGAARGLDRVVVGTQWSDGLREELRSRVSEEALGVIERVLGAREKVQDESELVTRMLEGGAGPALVAEVLDTISFGDDAFRMGRVDLGRATADVLGAIPGIDAEAASRLIEERSRLDAETLRRVTWPLERGVLEAEEFAKAAKWLTTRSLVWRVRIEARLEPMERRADEGEAEGEGASGPVAVMEAVIDVSAPRARVAYLRDVTLMGVAREVETRTAESAGAESGADAAVEDLAALPAVGAEADPGAAPVEDRASRMRRARESLDPSPGRLAGGVDEQAEAEAGRDGDTAGDEGGPRDEPGRGRANDGAGSDPVASGDEGVSSGPPPRRDRRIGRWAPRRP